MVDQDGYGLEDREGDGKNSRKTMIPAQQSWGWWEVCALAGWISNEISTRREWLCMRSQNLKSYRGSPTSSKLCGQSWLGLKIAGFDSVRAKH